MSFLSQPRLLVLHAVRLLGFADIAAIASRSGRDLEETRAFLDEAAHAGWVQHLELFDREGWSLTDFGRWENERQLARERRLADPTGVIAAVYDDFLPLNARMLCTTTDWQIKPTVDDRFAANDHTDPAWDSHVLDEIDVLANELEPLLERLTGVLSRFEGILTRFESALRMARKGHPEWVDRTDVDSCHLVWFQLHEDLIATLGLDRSSSK